MLPPIILGAQKLNSDSAKSVTRYVPILLVVTYMVCVIKIHFSSGYGSLPGSTRNSVIETNLPPVLGHPNMYTSESDIVYKSSPDTSPLATKKWSLSGYRQSREESNPWVHTGIFT